MAAPRSLLGVISTWLNLPFTALNLLSLAQLFLAFFGVAHRRHPSQPFLRTKQSSPAFADTGQGNGSCAAAADQQVSEIAAEGGQFQTWPSSS